VYGDSKKLKDETEIQRCRWYQLRNERLEGQLLDRDIVEKTLGVLAKNVEEVVKGSNLSKIDQRDILEIIYECAELASKVAEEQIRQLMKTPEEQEPDETAEV